LIVFYIIPLNSITDFKTIPMIIAISITFLSSQGISISRAWSQM